MHRRRFLKAASATAATLATVGRVSAATYQDQPEYVSLTYDLPTLETYRPYLVTRHLDIKPTAVYGWVADSTERETDVACYWVSYVTQQGVTSADSHQYDREPIYVEFDSETGEVQQVLVDGYHYLVKTYPGSLTLENDTHPVLHIVKPWHFYRQTTDLGELPAIEDMHDKFDPWVSNDWNVHKESVVNPWRVENRGHWWPDLVAGFSVNGTLWNAMLTAAQTTGFDFGGAQASDF